MSGFIELCGAPGVGKSALARALGGHVITLDGHARRLLPGTRAFSVARAPFRPVASLLEEPSVVARLSRVPRVCDRLLLTDVADADGTAHWVDEVASALEDLPAPAPGDVRAAHAYRSAAMAWTENTLRRVALAERLPQGVVLLLDEGLVQRSLTLLGSGATDHDRRRLLDRFPRPAAVVHLVAPRDLLLRRLRARHRSGHMARLHAGLRPEEALEIVTADAAAIASTVRLMADAGVPVIELRSPGAGRSVRSLRDDVLRGFTHPGAAPR